MNRSFALTLLLAPVAANAQALACTVPTELSRPRPDGPDQRTPARLIPTASYTLAISWSPQHCRDRADGFQCGGDNRFGFILHGLWPDGAGKEWPQYCRPVELLSEATLRANLCVTPSVQLLQHEWAKHGSCMNITADQYFAKASALYGSVKFPDMAALSRRRSLKVGAFAAAFARANRGMTPAMLRVTTEQGRWLDEVWLCLDLNFRNVACPAHQGGAPSSTRLAIWRGASSLVAKPLR